MRMTLLAKVLRLRRELTRRESWTRAQLETHQAALLRELRAYACDASSFYRRFHHGMAGAPLHELPILTKGMLMEHFDEVVTDREVRLQQVTSFLASTRGAELFRGSYYVARTAGTTGQPGIFLWKADEWAGILASYNRPYAWGGANFRLTRRSSMAVVSSTTPWHQSALVGATVDSPILRTLRIDSGGPLEDVVAQLQRFRPDVLVGYASMLRLLAAEQSAGRLHITPNATFSASEVLTDATRRAIATAWSREPFNVYAATETAGVAAECQHHTGMHLFEDLVITEVVDEQNRPVAPGNYGARVLVTVLGSRTIPLIRYELSDSVRLSSASACPCGMPFTRIDGLQGREQEALRLRGIDGGKVVIQPVVFHRIMDTVPASAWQIVRESAELRVLLAGLPVGSGSEGLAGKVRKELTQLGASGPPIRIERVASIPRTALGKAPLIRSVGTQPDP